MHPLEQRVDESAHHGPGRPHECVDEDREGGVHGGGIDVKGTEFMVPWRATCRCGRFMPSTPHIQWGSPQDEDSERQEERGAPRPEDRLEERLMLR